MTVEKPIDLGEVWFGNGSNAPVDIFVNNAPEPALSDLKALELGSVFTVDGSPTRPFQTHTFTVRPKEQPDATPLAVASVRIEKGKSFTAIYHQTEDATAKLSIFANDFSGAAKTRLEVRHTGTPDAIGWRISPSPAADPSISADPREGFLANGQWQQATEVVENTYVLEGLVDGAVVARRPSLELESNKMLAVYFVGNPRPTLNEKRLQQNWLVQEFQIPTADLGEATVTPPQAAFADSKADRPIRFDCAPVELWETNTGTFDIQLSDADGVISGVAVARVDPARGKIEIPDGGVTPAPTIGATATATVRVDGDTPSGDYLVRLKANPDSIAESATCTLPVKVKAITVDRLMDQLRRYQRSGAISEAVGTKARAPLETAQTAFEDGDFSESCQALGRFVTTLADAEGSGADKAAVSDLSRETERLQQQLGCG